MPDSYWALLLALFLIDLLFSAVRGSLLNARLPLLMDLAQGTPGNVQTILDLLDKPRLRTSLRLGVILIHFFIAAVGGWGAQRLFPQVWPSTPWLGLLAALIFALLVSVLEHLLEGLLLPNAEKWALRFSSTAYWMDKLLSPLSSILMRLLGHPAMLRSRLTPLTEYELKTWVEEGEQEGGLEKGEREMIYSIFHFGDRLAREIMVPRIDMQALDVSHSPREAAKLVSDTGHSRVPVYEDSPDNIIGVLYAKDLLKVGAGMAAADENDAPPDLRQLLRPTYFVPEGKKVDDLLQDMQRNRVHMALVVDEYGGIAGLVTLEDIMEEIVGEIQDEYDQGEENPYTPQPDGSVVFKGSIDLDDFNEVMGSHIDKDYADTLGGLMFTLFGRVPANGDSLEVDGLTLQVEQVSERRIRSVRASRSGLSEEPKLVEEGNAEPSQTEAKPEENHIGQFSLLGDEEKPEHDQ